MAKGIDPATVQTYAGHSNLTTTLNVYSHFIPQADAHDRLEAAEAQLG
jgi:integrase